VEELKVNPVVFLAEKGFNSMANAMELWVAN